MSKQAKWEEIGEMFHDEGLARLETGNLLRFRDSDGINEYAIRRIRRSKHRVYVEKVKTYTLEEWESIAKEKAV